MKSTEKSLPPLDLVAVAKAASVLLVFLLISIIAVNAKSFMPLVFVVAGALWLGWAGWIIYLSNTSRSRPVTQGTVVENAVKEVSRLSKPGWITYSFPVIAYRYSVDGVEYISRRIAIFPSDLEYPEQKEKPEILCERYPMNSVVNVYYNPYSPKDGVLIVGALSRSRQHSIVFIVTGSFLLSVGIFLFYVEFWIR